MNREARDRIDHYFPELVQDIIPVDMLPYLACLTQSDREMIRSEETNRGPMRAATELLSRIRRRNDGFQEFIGALRATGCGHLADLLDPREEDGENVDNLPEADERRFAEMPLLRDQVALEDVNHA